MIFIGREHPIFDSFIKNHCEKAIFTDPIFGNTHRTHYISKKLIENGKKYFFHPGTPLFDPTVDMEYFFNFEDQATLYRTVENGVTSNINFHKLEETDYIRYVLEDPRCKKIICHIEKMAQTLPKLLQSEIIANKTVYKNIGIELKKDIEIIPKEKKEFTILFTNSFQDHEYSILLRGGDFVVRAFQLLSQKHNNVKLIMRAGLKGKNKQIASQILGDKIEIIDKFCSQEEIDKIYRRSDIVVLPAARVHSHSICQAFSYGLPVIVSDGWGMDEYIQPFKNGLQLEGFNRLISWHDNNFGCIENYDMIKGMPQVIMDNIVEQLYYYLDFLITNPQALVALRENCLEICKTKYSLLNWEEWKI